MEAAPEPGQEEGADEGPSPQFPGDPSAPIKPQKQEQLGKERPSPVREGLGSGWLGYGAFLHWDLHPTRLSAVLAQGSPAGGQRAEETQARGLRSQPLSVELPQAGQFLNRSHSPSPGGRLHVPLLRRSHNNL